MAEIIFPTRVLDSAQSQSLYNSKTPFNTEVGKANTAFKEGKIGTGLKATGRGVEDAFREITSTVDDARKDIGDSFVPAIRTVIAGFRGFPAQLAESRKYQDSLPKDGPKLPIGEQ